MLPVQAHVFNVVPFVALLSNPFIVPLSGVFLFAGLALLPLPRSSRPASRRSRSSRSASSRTSSSGSSTALDRLHAVRVVPTPPFALAAAVAGLLLVAGLATARAAEARGSRRRRSSACSRSSPRRPAVADARDGRPPGRRRGAGRRVAPRDARRARPRGRRREPGPRVRVRAAAPRSAARRRRGRVVRRGRAHAPAPGPRARASRRPHVAARSRRVVLPRAAPRNLVPRRVLAVATREAPRPRALGRRSRFDGGGPLLRRAPPGGRVRTRARGRTTDLSSCGARWRGAPTPFDGRHRGGRRERPRRVGRGPLGRRPESPAPREPDVDHAGVPRARLSPRRARRRRPPQPLRPSGAGRRLAGSPPPGCASSGPTATATSRCFSGGPRPAGLPETSSRGPRRERARPGVPRDRRPHGDGEVRARRRARRASRGRDRLGGRVRGLPRVRRRHGQAGRRPLCARAAPPRGRARAASSRGAPENSRPRRGASARRSSRAAGSRSSRAGRASTSARSSGASSRARAGTTRCGAALETVAARRGARTSSGWSPFLDPEAAARLADADASRAIRLLEILFLSGERPSRLFRERPGRGVDTPVREAPPHVAA